METAVAVKEDMVISKEDIKKYIAPTATDKELFMFMGVCKAYGLNPLKREIHFVKRRHKDDKGNWVEVGSSIIGYEIYLKRAERTGKLDGWKCWIEKDDIGQKAIIEIKRKDQSTPIKWEVYRKEFDTEKSTWLKMPTFMLKKVAIAQGFRLAFPDDLGGMPYIPEELPVTADHVTSEKLDKDIITIDPDKPKDDAPDFQPTQSQAPEEKTSSMPILTSQPANVDVISVAQGKRLFAISNSSGIETEQLKLFLIHFYGYEHSNQVTKNKYEEICGLVSSKEKFSEIMKTVSSRAA